MLFLCRTHVKTRSFTNRLIISLIQACGNTVCRRFLTGTSNCSLACPVIQPPDHLPCAVAAQQVHPAAAEPDVKGVGIIAHILEMGAQPAAREPAYIAAEGAAAPHAEHVRGLALPQGGLSYVGVAEALGSPHPAQHERVGRQFDAAWRYKVVIKQYAEDRQRGQQHYDERHKYERLDEHHVPAWHEHRHEQHPNAHRHAAHGAALAYFVDIVITHVSHNPRFCHKVSKKQPQHRQIQEQNGLSPCFFLQTQYNAPFRHGRCPAKAPVGAATSAFSELLHNNFGTKAKYCYFCNNL